MDIMDILHYRLSNQKTMPLERNVISHLLNYATNQQKINYLVLIKEAVVKFSIQPFFTDNYSAERFYDDNYDDIEFIRKDIEERHGYPIRAGLGSYKAYMANLAFSYVCIDLLNEFSSVQARYYYAILVLKGYFENEKKSLSMRIAQLDQAIRGLSLVDDIVVCDGHLEIQRNAELYYKYFPYVLVDIERISNLAFAQLD